MSRLMTIAVALAALLLTLPVAASADVLWSQFDRDSANSVFATSISPPAQSSSQELADDFLVDVTPGNHWRIDEVDVHGVSTGEVDAVRVSIYGQNGPLPADTPLTTRDGLTPLSGLDTGNFAIPLAQPIELAGGTYWLSVQGVQGAGGVWDWFQRGSPQNLHHAAVRNGGNPISCPTWRSIDTCYTGLSDPDLSFQLAGSVVSDAPPVPAPGPPTAPATPPPDVTAPVLRASARHSQSIRHGFITVTDRTNEAATDTATGSVSIGHVRAARSYRLKSAKRRHGAGRVILRLRLRKATRKAARHALARHRRVIATVRVSSRDAAGNRSRTRVLHIRLRR